MARAHEARRTAVTLLELLGVVTILAALAGLVIGLVGDAGAKARSDGSALGLAEVRKAILGTPASPGYQGDLLRLPDSLADLLRPPAFAPAFDLATGIGWRGPYLGPATATYVVDPANGFVAAYGANGDPAVLDAWGRPLVLQIPDPAGMGVPTAADRRHARLVSAGPDGVLRTPRTDAEATPPGTAHYPTRTQCDDDLVLYLQAADVRPQ